MLVARSCEGLEERVTVAGRAVAKVRPLRERPGAPGQLATRKQQSLMLAVVARHAGE